MIVKTLLISIAVLLICCKNIEAALIIFDTDSSTSDVGSIRNCSCVLGSPTCTSTALLASPFCSCVSSSLSEVNAVAENARSSDSVSWWNVDPLTICCESVSGSAAAKQLLTDIMDFSYVSRVTINLCENLVPSTDEYLTIYGLQEISIQTVVAANNPNQFISMTDTDLASTNPRSREYRDYHIAFVGLSLLDGNSELKAWSVWTTPQTADTSIQQTGVNRAPEIVTSKSDGNIMFTAIYA